LRIHRRLLSYLRLFATVEPTGGGVLEQDTIRARSIELVNERGELAMTLDGGGGDRDPGIVIYGPAPAVTLLVRRENGMPYIMANTAAGTAIQLTFLLHGTPVVNLRDQDGNDRTITP
jgi:hypothetical protein